MRTPLTLPSILRSAPRERRALPPFAYAFALLSVACGGFPQSNAIDLPRTDGVPVELKNVRMAESLAATLGPIPTTFSSSSGSNAIGVAFDVHVVDAAPQYAGVSARIACRIGDHTVVAPMAMDANNRLATAALGTKLEERTTFMPTPLSSAIPEVCEATLFYTIAPPLPAKSEARAIGTVCFSGGTLAEGACASDILPRTPAPTPVAVSSVIGRIGPLSGGGHGVGVTVLATAGEGVPQQFLIGGEATCEAAGATKDISIGLLMFGTDLQPGESQLQSASTRQSDALPTAPAWCTVRVQLADHGDKRTLAELCVRGDETTPGACSS